MTFEEFCQDRNIRNIVKTIVKKYLEYEEYEELKQVAWIGVWLAFKKYNGVDSKLTTYVYNNVTWSIQKHLRDTKKLFKAEKYGVHVTVNSEIIQDRLSQMGTEDDYTKPYFDILVAHIESKLKRENQRIGFKYMMKNYNNREIGEIVGVSPQMVRIWRKNIREEIIKFEKLKVVGAN